MHFDEYFNESDLHDRGELDAALDRLTASGHVYQADGATWVRTTDFGDDKDRVYVRGNGEFTYFAADCAYYLDKRRRGFGKVIIILGADHHGYIGRMRAVAACFGDDPDQTLEILIGQLVSLVRDGQPVRMSKRAGTVVTIDDLVDAIGVDAARYALARYSLDSPIDLDLDLWTRRSNDNPVYYVQYAHARIASLLRQRRRGGYRPRLGLRPVPADPRPRERPAEGPGRVPRRGRHGGRLRQPHRVARYLEDLAGTLPPVLRRLPDPARGTARPSTTHEGRGCGWPRPRGSLRPTASACSASARPTACSSGPYSRRRVPTAPTAIPVRTDLRQATLDRTTPFCPYRCFVRIAGF